MLAGALLSIMLVSAEVEGIKEKIKQLKKNKPLSQK